MPEERASRIARLTLVAWMVLPSVACDQATKQLAREVLEPGRGVEWLGGIVRFQFAENAGGFLSLGASLPEPVRVGLFLGLIPVGLILAARYILQNANLTRATLCGLSLIVAGGLGNLLDRIFNGGAVVDFVSIGFGALRSGIFNVADVAIVVGALLVVAGSRGAETES